ncbi:hypothetical protein cypCar_00003929 [Cyprinus carpio]|nr:hypothetical protein cypCar_00003929 [Cyprinus carpio]
MTTVVQSSELVFEFASNGMDEINQLDDPSVFPAVIVEQVPAADLMQVYSGLEADEVTNGIMVDAIQDVVEESMMGDVGLSVETPVSSGEDNMETIEAAEALLNMESPNNILDEKRMIHTYGNILESDLTYISLRPEQLSNGCMDVPLDEETSSMDEIPQKNLSKPIRKSKEVTIFLQSSCSAQTKTSAALLSYHQSNSPIEEKEQRGQRYYYQRAEAWFTAFKEMAAQIWSLVTEDDSQEGRTSSGYGGQRSAPHGRAVGRGSSRAQGKSAQVKSVKREMSPGLNSNGKQAEQLMQTVHVLQPNQGAAVPASTHSIRTINMPGSVPMVLTSGAQGGGPVTLQTLPLPSVLTNGDSSTHASPPRVILHTVPSTSPGSKDVLTIQTASLTTDSIQSQQLLVSTLGSSSGAVISTTPQQAGSLNGITRLVTLNANGQPVVAQQPGTVIATVLKPSELQSLQVKEEILDPQYLQSLVNSNPNVASYGKDELEEGVAELSYRTVIINSAGQELCQTLNGHSDMGSQLASSPSEGLTPVEELEVRGEVALHPESEAKELLEGSQGLQELQGTMQIPASHFIQVKAEPAET